ncbi:MAG: hypothetical protein K9J16_09205 [Melioribacteraceae bacterium]|nr:hypothetical protein [Melioribacteraceae bacterium]MCF8353216.1 hypothetical protein [Melioribacteraceae bacterium]MCF8395607.1 hypothetical protein [Melioribacteraceae bacterium]MCF8418750.1 hypothetical protein [Melioribacteraceae bacterium]
MDGQQIICRTPSIGKKPTKISKEKFELIRDRIIEILSKNNEGVLFKDLPKMISERLTVAQRSLIGSISWYTTTVKLELEVRGEIKRIPNSKPQRLILTK